MLRTGLDIVVARRTAGLTQTELARLAGIHRTSLSHLEWSAKCLPTRRVEQIERALQLAGTGDDHPNEAA
jgi:DNA-binding XRE family transcriptional regulator